MSRPFLEALHIEVDDEKAPSDGSPGRVVIRLSGELDTASVPHLRTILGERLDPNRDAVIDLAGLRFIDSTGLGVLVGALKKQQTAGHALALRAPTSSLRRVLDTTGLSAAFPIEP